jgi:two-component system, cell cycle sensor histidine kinase and response regulator CckA
MAQKGATSGISRLSQALGSRLGLKVASGNEGSADGMVEAMATRGTILLVDDDESIRMVFSRLLCARGYFVIQAVGGVDALAKARDHAGPIDLLLTDIIMPDMDGNELGEAFNAARPDTKVLLMSGSNPPLGGSNFLPKPFTIDELARRIEVILDNGSAAGPSRLGLKQLDPLVV